MIQACRTAGVRVYADAVVNHSKRAPLFFACQYQVSFSSYYTPSLISIIFSHIYLSDVAIFVFCCVITEYNTSSGKSGYRCPKPSQHRLFRILWTQCNSRITILHFRKHLCSQSPNRNSANHGVPSRPIWIIGFPLREINQFLDRHESSHKGLPGRPNRPQHRESLHPRSDRNVHCRPSLNWLLRSPFRCRKTYWAFFHSSHLRDREEENGW